VATQPPPDPATRRPKGAEPGSKGGAMLDLLATAGGPLRRGTLAEAADLSPTTVDKLLTAWADLGVAVKVGSLWTVSTSYRSSGMLSLDGQEDEHS
jgi:DNA-binding IclR family transcriptional regulator